MAFLSAFKQMEE